MYSSYRHPGQSDIIKNETPFSPIKLEDHQMRRAEYDFNNGRKVIEHGINSTQSTVYPALLEVIITGR